jgi:hypothetical protein
MNFLLDYSELIASFSYLIPLVPAWIFFRKCDAEFRLFIIILSISFIVTLAGYYTAKNYINNLWLYFSFNVVEFYLYSLLFKRLLSTRFVNRFINITIVLFVLLIILNAGNALDLNNYDSYTASFVNVAILLYCILFFNAQLNNPQITFIYKTTWFWIMTGLLLFFAGSFLIFLFTNYLMYRDVQLVVYLWTLRDFLDIIKNLLIATGLLFIKNEQWKRSY